MDLLQQQTYILIPVHNRKQITLRCLENLQQCLDIDQFMILVIDDGSTDGTSDAIQTLYPHIKVLNGDGSLWWTGAIALGMKYAYRKGADFIIWLNDDCELQPQTLNALVFYCQKTNSIIGAQGINKEKPVQLAFGGKRKTWKGFRFLYASPNEVLPCDLLSGNVVCLPRAVIDSVGYPDAQVTPHYGGDSLYLIQAKKAGFQLYVDGRYPASDLPGESSLYPNNWLTCDGDPERLLKLGFNRYSGLSWRLWWRLNWEVYSVWGSVMFLKKYLSLLLITLLRYGLYFKTKFSKYE